MKMEEQANKYLSEYSLKNDVFRPKYHFTSKTGWINDPHGLVYFKGEYHLFFQFHPYETASKEMYWGHTTTKDFIHFKDVTCAIAPDKYYDNSGCWSGSVIVKDDILYLFYTGFSLHEDGKYYQTVCMAYSHDGINFIKSDLNPIIDTNLIPAEANPYDFRDPCVFKENDKYYLIIGSKNDSEAMLILYESDDLLKFKFTKILVKDTKFGTMFECPNIARFDDANYIIMSPQNIKIKDDSFFNVSSSVYFKLPKDFYLKDCVIEEVKEIDHGFEYYAPNVCDNEKILVAWEQMWGRRYYLNEIKADYINNFTLFKKIVKENDTLKFIPLDIYKTLFKDEKVIKLNLFKNEEKVIEIEKEAHFDALFEISNDLILEMKMAINNEEYILFNFNFKEKLITIDRTKMKVQLFGVDNTLATKGIRTLRIDDSFKNYKIEGYIDSPSIELFLHDFKDSISLLYFNEATKMSFKANKDLNIEFKKQKIEVK